MRRRLPPRPGRALAHRAALALALLSLAPAAWAGPPTDQLRQHVDRLVQILEDPALRQPARTRERRAAIRAVAERVFDFEEIARRALGPHWRARTPEERREFVALFTDLLESAYVTKLEQYQGEKVVYAGEHVEGDLATVRTRVVARDGTEIPIDYRMHRTPDGWRIYDVLIEGVSLVANYRAQFDRIIRTGSYQALVEKLRAREFTPPPAGKPRRTS